MSRRELEVELLKAATSNDWATARKLARKLALAKLPRASVRKAERVVRRFLDVRREMNDLAQEFGALWDGDDGLYAHLVTQVGAEYGK